MGFICFFFYMMIVVILTIFGRPLKEKGDEAEFTRWLMIALAVIVMSRIIIPGLSRHISLACDIFTLMGIGTIYARARFTPKESKQ